MAEMIEKFVEEPDGQGGFRLVCRMVPAPAKKGKAPRPDPIQSQTIVQSEGGEVVAADLLRQLVERIEHLEAEKSSLLDDIKEVYAEAKAQGFDIKTMRQIIRLRRMDAHKRQEAEALLETYYAALGMEHA